MRKFTAKEVPATTIQVESIHCDLCGAEDVNGNWGAGNFSVDEVTIEAKSGNNFPEGGSGKILRCDVCPACFEDKVIPALESIGLKMNESEWEW